MAVYAYKAVTRQGETLEGEMEAPDELAVIRQLQDAGHIPIRARPARSSRAGLRFGLRPRSGRVGLKQVAAFTRELSTLLQAGLPLDRALQTLIDLAEEDSVLQLLTRLQERVRGGAPFSDALEAESGVFSRLYVNLVRAGEAGGALELVLERLAEYLERSRELRDTVISALLYPSILLFVAVLSVVLLLVLVIPQFTQLFEDMGQALPVPTQIVIAAGNLFRSYWWLLVLIVAGGAWYLRRRLDDPKKRYSWDGAKLRIPLLGDLLGKVEMARFSHTLSTLLNNGVPLLTALGIVKETIDNRVVAEKIEEAADSLKQGKGLVQPMMESGVFPPFALHMMKVGEESGQLETMLTRVGQVYDREVRTTVQRVLALLEPILIVGLGLLIAGIIMSILVAVLSVNQLAF